MPEFASPLRYPGGKEGLNRLLGKIIQLNGLSDAIYAEPYAGGAGAGLRLLFGEHVAGILINDLDYCVIAFWRSILDRTREFLQLLAKTPVTLDEWFLQRSIYRKPARHSQLRVGFATFFLNRCNRSGILMDGGPIGGIAQKGKWRLDARYYPDTMRRRIERIVAYRDRIQVFNLDSLEFLRKTVKPLSKKRNVFVYLDPPYYVKGSELYLNAYEHKDHERVSKFLAQSHDFHWLMSYDNVRPIRTMYDEMQQVAFGLTYTAYKRRVGRELLICPNNLILPTKIKPWVERRNAS
jgi:DNA adenine methylase